MKTKNIYIIFIQGGASKFQTLRFAAARRGKAVTQF